MSWTPRSSSTRQFTPQAADTDAAWGDNAAAADGFITQAPYLTTEDGYVLSTENGFLLILEDGNWKPRPGAGDWTPRKPRSTSVFS